MVGPFCAEDFCLRSLRQGNWRNPHTYSYDDHACSDGPDGAQKIKLPLYGGPLCGGLQCGGPHVVENPIYVVEDYVVGPLCGGAPM